MFFNVLLCGPKIKMFVTNKKEAWPRYTFYGNITGILFKKRYMKSQKDIHFIDKTCNVENLIQHLTFQIHHQHMANVNRSKRDLG